MFGGGLWKFVPEDDIKVDFFPLSSHCFGE